MVDTISEADAYRMGKVLDYYVTDEHPNQPPPTEQEEIEDALEDRMADWTQTQIEGFAKAIADRRKGVTGVTSDTDRVKLENKTTLSGGGVTGVRTAMQQAADGTFIGKTADVKTYTDTHGNLMGHNSNTGTRKKLIDSAER